MTKETRTVINSNNRILKDLFKYLKSQHPNLPNHVFEALGEVIDDLKSLDSEKKYKVKKKVEEKEVRVDLTKLKVDWLVEKFHEISDELMNGETIDEVEITIENNKLYCYFEIDCNRSGTWDGFITINEKGVVKVSLDDTPIEACGIEDKLAKEIKKIIIED